MLYFNSMKGEFHFDDYAYIVNSQQIKKFKLSARNVFSHPLSLDRELVSLSFSANYAIHGLSYKGYQFVNIIIHALNGFIIYLIGIYLFSINIRSDFDIENVNKYLNNIYALAAALLFIAHPLAVNSVSYISQRHGLMATTFYLLSFYFFIKAIDCKGTRRLKMFCFTFISFFLSIHCKPMAITLPIVLVNYYLIFKEKEDRYNFSKIIIIFACFAFFGYAWWYANSNSLLTKGVSSTAGFRTKNFWSIKIHLMTETKVFLQYLKIIFFPFPNWLCVDRVVSLTKTLDIFIFWCFLVHSTIISVSFILLKHGYKMPFFGVSWFYLTLLPYLFVPIQDVMVDYKTYLPSAGLILMAADSACRFGKKYGNHKVAICAVAIFILFSWATIIRIKTFETEISFWTDVINKEGNKERGLNNRGLAWMKMGNYSNSLNDFNQAISCYPEYQLAYVNAGDACLKTGRHKKSLIYYNNYRKLCGNCPDSHVRLGNVYMAIKKWGEGEKHYRKAIVFEKTNAMLWYNLGISYMNMEKFNKSEYAFNKAIHYKPDYHQAYSSLGVVYFKTGKLDKAEKMYEKSISLNQKYINAAYNLSILKKIQTKAGGPTAFQ